MAVLDEQEAAARELVAPTAMEAAEVVDYLRKLPSLWDDAPLSRRAMSESLFERVDVLGLRSMHLEPTPAAMARGLAEAFSSASAGYGRGERAQGSANQQIRGCRVTMPVPERRIRLVG